MTVSSLLVTATILLPWLGALLVWLAGDRRSGWQHGLAVASALAAGAAALVLLDHQSSAVALSLPMGSVFGEMTFVADGLGVFLTAVATVVGSLAVIFSVDYMRGEAQLGRYYIFVLLFIGAMSGLALSGSLLFLFFFWEITALCSYALISFYNDDPRAVAGGIKALIMTQLGGVGLLAGALAVSATLHTYQISALLARAGTLPPAVMNILAFGFLVAAAAKSAQFPFQTWLPDAMEAPTPVSALIHAATMVNAGVYLLARFYPAFHTVTGWTTAVMAVGMVSAFSAALMAAVATDLKRVLAYSTVSQLGFMVYAVGAGGILASQFHLFSHAVFKALLFLGAGAAIHAVGTRDMRRMGDLGDRMPFIRNTFIIGALALAGLPILNGFWSKEMILEAGLNGGPAWMFAIMVFVAGLTAFYTFRMVWLVFYGQERDHLHAHDAADFMRIALGLLAAGSLLTWLAIEPFASMLQATLPYHAVETLSFIQMCKDILLAPATWLALVVIGMGLLAWRQHKRLEGLSRSLGWLSRWAQASFGFEWINRQVARFFRHASDGLGITQTGQLNWNIAGILAGLLVVLAILAWVA